ncbi:hypothetical protein SprV_0100031900 [Sparganum proliferum]
MKDELTDVFDTEDVEALTKVAFAKAFSSRSGVNGSFVYFMRRRTALAAMLASQRARFSRQVSERGSVHKFVNPPADAPYSALKAEILRLNAVSDRQRYHQLIKEESLGDRKPELLRRMRILLGDMQVDEKLVKEMFLERLPADVQTILASGSQDLTLSHLAKMADRMIEVQRLQPPSVAQISTSSSTVNEQLLQQMSTMANEIASLKLQLARITCSRSPSRHRSRSRPRTANLCWYHANFAAKARKCSSPCSFKPKQGNQPARE